MSQIDPKRFLLRKLGKDYRTSISMDITPSISIIIPIYNERENLISLLPHLRSLAPDNEIILVDSPHSTDRIDDLVAKWQVEYLQASQAGRAFQMNAGAAVASGSILYFVHADTRLHPDFLSDIPKAILNGADLGCYRYRFDQYPHVLLYINSFFTRFNPIWCRGGDQTLFIKREAFAKLTGFNTECLIMEDYDILLRAQKLQMTFQIIPQSVVVSARKYATNSYWRVQWANFTLMRLFLRRTRSFQEMATLYKKMLDYR